MAKRVAIDWATPEVDKCQAFFKCFAHSCVPSVMFLTNELAPKKRKINRVKAVRKLLYRWVRHASKISKIVGVVAPQDDFVGSLVEH